MSWVQWLHEFHCHWTFKLVLRQNGWNNCSTYITKNVHALSNVGFKDRTSNEFYGLNKATDTVPAEVSLDKMVFSVSKNNLFNFRHRNWIEHLSNSETFQRTLKKNKSAPEYVVFWRVNLQLFWFFLVTSLFRFFRYVFPSFFESVFWQNFKR